MSHDTTRPPPRLIKRHSALVRATHWVNALCLVLLLMSGLQIFNAHPALYIGKASTFDAPVFAIDSRDVGGKTEGYTALFGHSVNTSGVLGLSNVAGQPTERAFPSWITLPSNQDLSTGRQWHFLMAWLLVINGLAYLVYGLVSRHFARDIVPDRAELAHTGQAVVDHLKLKFPHGENARRYNVLQKLAYFGVIFVALPLIVLAGWTMSPGLDAVFPFLTTAFGGRQTARTIHFVVAFGLVGFFVVHIAMVLLTGVFNNMRSMITGWFDTGEAKDGEATHA
ncbi:MAG: cytochrome b/b6 domain-containing protein [Janthinobacterium lividum]